MSGPRWSSSPEGETVQAASFEQCPPLRRRIAAAASPASAWRRERLWRMNHWGSGAVMRSILRRAGVASKTRRLPVPTSGAGPRVSPETTWPRAGPHAPGAGSGGSWAWVWAPDAMPGPEASFNFLNLERKPWLTALKTPRPNTRAAQLQLGPATPVRDAEAAQGQGQAAGVCPCP